MYINKCAYLRSESLPEGVGGHMCDKELEKKGWEEEEILKERRGKKRNDVWHESRRWSWYKTVSQWVGAEGTMEEQEERMK